MDPFLKLFQLILSDCLYPRRIHTYTPTESGSVFAMGNRSVNALVEIRPEADELNYTNSEP